MYLHLSATGADTDTDTDTDRDREIDMESSTNKLIKNISAELNFGLWAIIMLALFDLKSVQLN